MDNTRDAIGDAAPVTPNDVIKLDEEVAALAKLKPLEYDRVREAKAKELGVRVATLDKEVFKARGDNGVTDKNGTPFIIEEIEPFDKSVAGAALLTDIQTTIKRFVVMDGNALIAVVLWIVHTYCYNAFYASPILGITSPERRCGKTTLQGLLAALTHRPLPTSNISPAAIFRCIERWQPTLLIDEADTFLKGNEEIRGIINSGHTRPTAFVIRIDPDSGEPMRFSTWAPKAIALIGKLPATLHDRAIGIAMRRKFPTEKVEKLRQDRIDLKPLQRQCLRWAMDNMETLRASDPAMPEGLNDRAADNWRPLLTIAELAGEDWKKATLAAIRTLAEGDDDHEESRVKLLADIRDIFADKQADCLASADLVAALVAMEDRPWSEWGKTGKSLTTNQLARLLRPFKIKPDKKRFDKPLQGYDLTWFEDAFKRYIPPNPGDPPIQTGTPEQDNKNKDLGDFPTGTQGNDVPVENEPNPLNNKHCSGVPVETTPADDWRTKRSFEL